MKVIYALSLLTTMVFGKRIQRSAARDRSTSCWGDWNCDEGKICLNRQCSDLLETGSVCKRGSQCVSKICNSVREGRYNGVCVESVKNGDYCNDDDECDSGFCKDYTSWAKGVCYPPKLENGEDCINNVMCLSGVCSASSGTCATKCRYNSQCDSTEYCCAGFNNCESFTGEWPYSCEPKLHVGDTCRWGSDCISGECPFSLFACRSEKVGYGGDCTLDIDCEEGICSEVTNTCSHNCIHVDECPDRSNQYCAEREKVPYSCEKKLEVGQKCKNFYHTSECKSGRCDPQTRECQVPLEIGDGCVSHTDCISGLCDWYDHPQLCIFKERVEVGEKCQFDTDCLEGFCLGRDQLRMVCSTNTTGYSWDPKKKTDEKED